MSEIRAISTPLQSPVIRRILRKEQPSKFIPNEGKNVIDLCGKQENQKNMENNHSMNSNNLVKNLVGEKRNIENDTNEENQVKRKKDWKSWSSTEKELFYEAIANGANYCSLQKLFKNMNDVNY